jgi:hypothetical protein
MKKTKNNEGVKRVDLLMYHLAIPLELELTKRNESGVKTTAAGLVRDFVKDGLQPERLLAAEELALLRAEVELLRRELAPVGGNLNQLAHLFNMHHPTDVSHVERQHHKLIRVFSSISKQLKSIEKSLW